MANHLFMTDAEVAKMLGLGTDEFKATAIVLQREGFPMPDPLFKRRRYWPAVKAFLDQRYNLGSQIGAGAHARLDGKENWD
jgi:hypothetical protein